MNLLYNFGIKAYALGARIAASRSKKVAKMIAGQRETYDRLRRDLGEHSRCVWVHAASLGEFEQGRPLIERLRREYPDRKILLTFFSPSGYEVRKNYPGVDAVAYLPFDTRANVRRFLDIVDPSVAIFVKYEFWGNYLAELRRRDVDTYIISAIFRPGQIFFRPWGGMFRRMLGCFTRIFVQDEGSKQLLAGIGIENVTVAGDTRFDRVTDIMAAAPAIPGAEYLHPDVVVGSSWPADEAGYIPWLKANPQVRFIIAPHEFDDARIADLIAQLGEGVIRYSEWEARVGQPDFDSTAVRGIIVDCFGRLAALYRFGRIAYVGGGFGAGIHNINEAAVYGIPVVFGPRHAKFKEAADLIAAGGAFDAATPAAAAEHLDLLYRDNAQRTAAGSAAGSYIRANLGATDKIFTMIFGN